MLTTKRLPLAKDLGAQIQVRSLHQPSQNRTGVLGTRALTNVMAASQRVKVQNVWLLVCGSASASREAHQGQAPVQRVVDGHEQIVLRACVRAASMACAETRALNQSASLATETRDGYGRASLLQQPARLMPEHQPRQTIPWRRTNRALSDAAHNESFRW